MKLAREAALLSTLPTKVGCLLVRDGGVLVSAHNCLPGSVQTTHERLHGQDRHAWQEHAERNAIYGLAASNGGITRGCTSNVTRFCCVECARCLIQSGIKRVCAPLPDFDDATWGRSCALPCACWKSAVSKLLQLMSKLTQSSVQRQSSTHCCPPHMCGRDPMNEAWDVLSWAQGVWHS